MQQRIPCRTTTIVDLDLADGHLDREGRQKIRDWNALMAVGPPFAFINGKAIAQPTLDAIIAEYQQSQNAD